MKGYVLKAFVDREGVLHKRKADVEFATDVAKIYAEKGYIQLSKDVEKAEPETEVTNVEVTEAPKKRKKK